MNASGPWIDRVNHELGLETRLIGGTKGSHILLDHPGLIRALNSRMIYFEADDGRICLVFDYLGRALVGSTDIRADDPDTLRCEDGEIAYFLESLRASCPDLTSTRARSSPPMRASGPCPGRTERRRASSAATVPPRQPFPARRIRYEESRCYPWTRHPERGWPFPAQPPVRRPA